MKTTNPDESIDMQKFCYIGIMGAPNAGKSTLMNKILNKKCSIVSARPHTTQTSVIGILTTNDTQIAFIDTPGISMQKNSPRALETEANQLFIVIDATTKDLSFNIKIIENLLKIHENRDIKLGIILNKIDLIHKYKLLPRIQELSNYTKTIFPISAKNGEGIDDLIAHAKNLATPKRWQFDKDEIIDKNREFFVSEEIREKLLIYTKKEIPFISTIKIDQIKDYENFIEIYATIFVKKDSQKGIIIGKNGQRLKEIGMNSRLDLMKFFDKNVRLFINVKLNKL
ncbi:GTPase Era [Candidatus Gromoviella agglomerans]|uniref:GTPase Era n=1 Tax=Candidatus Gromoviella agglomerans TaxID=2806609 RepID=UPI001E364099|nr:GTPase Era [Candidatus Gromoviella agglomerans]UFX98366.1 GTPase Era [Candidatus Gromoviella agglomerans]